LHDATLNQRQQGMQQTATRTCKPVENYYSRRMAKKAAAKLMLDQIFGGNNFQNPLVPAIQI
jgi:hypothetical protein